MSLQSLLAQSSKYCLYPEHIGEAVWFLGIFRADYRERRRRRVDLTVGWHSTTCSLSLAITWMTSQARKLSRVTVTIAFDIDGNLNKKTELYATHSLRWSISFSIAAVIHKNEYIPKPWASLFSITKAFFLILALQLSAEFGVRNFDESIRVVKLQLTCIIEDTNAAEVVKISSGTFYKFWSCLVLLNRLI